MRLRLLHLSKDCRRLAGGGRFLCGVCNRHCLLLFVVHHSLSPSYCAGSGWRLFGGIGGRRRGFDPVHFRSHTWETYSLIAIVRVLLLSKDFRDVLASFVLKAILKRLHHGSLFSWEHWIASLLVCRLGLLEIFFVAFCTLHFQCAESIQSTVINRTNSWMSNYWNFIAFFCWIELTFFDNLNGILLLIECNRLPLYKFRPFK